VSERRFALVLVTDGRRDCLRSTLDSAAMYLGLEHFEWRIAIDDSADASYGVWLDDILSPSFEVVHHLERRGFGGAVASAWSRIPPEATHCVHCEDDFVFLQPVELKAMADVLDGHPRIAQMALLRQPWNDEERAAGGIVACHPEDYQACVGVRGGRWLLHRRCWTTNPSVFRAEVAREHPWPVVPHSEGIYTHHLLAEGYEFAYWGRRDDPPRVAHIGDQRVGHGY